jgi:hypothetical protein
MLVRIILLCLFLISMIAIQSCKTTRWSSDPTKNPSTENMVIEDSVEIGVGIKVND